MIRKLLLAAQLLLAASVPALAQGATCEGEGAVKSVPTDVASEIVFENGGNEAVQLFWVDYGGERVAYGEIGAGQDLRQPSYLGQAWLVAGASGECKGVWYADGVPRSVVLQAAATPDAGPRVPPRRPTPAVEAVPETGPEGNAAEAGETPCRAGEYWNRSRNICINTSTREQRRVGPSERRSTAAPADPEPETAPSLVLQCRAGFVQVGTRCVPEAEAGSAGNAGNVGSAPPPAPRAGNATPRPAAAPPPAAPTSSNGGGQANPCGPGFTEIGGGCIANSLLPKN